MREAVQLLERELALERSEKEKLLKENEVLARAAETRAEQLGLGHGGKALAKVLDFTVLRERVDELERSSAEFDKERRKLEAQV